VSVVQHALQQDGLIGYTRGMVTIYDRAGLEAVACECYGVSACLSHGVSTVSIAAPCSAVLARTRHCGGAATDAGAPRPTMRAGGTSNTVARSADPRVAASEIF
jgi:hypothetical protein